MNKILKNHGLLVILSILSASIAISILHVAFFGYGVQFEEVILTKKSISTGEVSTILLKLRNNEPEVVGIGKINTYIKNDPEKNIEIKDSEIIIKQIPKFTTTKEIPITLTASDTLIGNNFEYDVVLILTINEIEMDRKYLKIKII